jgi:hypothetical protein
VIKRNSFQDLGLESNLCKKCNMHTVGDELHYIIECTLFDTDGNRLLRKQMQFPNYIYPEILIINEIFRDLMCPSSPEKIKNLADFCNIIVNSFKNESK